MLTRGPPAPAGAIGIRSRLLATRLVRPSSTGDPVAHTASTASSVPPPVNTHRCRNRPLFRLVQQLVAPGDRVAHGLLPGRQVVRAVHQHRQPAGQPGQQVTGRQQPQPGRGQLDGQRDPVQPAADLGDGLDRRLVRRELNAGRLRPVKEQLHRGRFIGGAGIPGSRQRQRGDRVLPAGPDPQRRPAGDQRDRARAGFQQPDHGIPGGQHVLEVVQHHEHAAIAQRRPQPFGQRGRVPLVHAQLPGQAVEHKPRVPQRREVDEHDPVRVVARHPPGHLDGQPGLADAARAGEDQQLRVAAAQQPDHGRGQPGPADQRRQRPGQGGGADDRRPFGPISSAAAGPRPAGPPAHPDRGPARRPAARSCRAAACGPDPAPGR